MTGKVCEFFAEGKPAPKGSWRHVGNGRMVSMAKGEKSWRKALQAAAEAGMQAPLVRRGDVVFVEVEFIMPRPKARKHDIWHATSPDLDKLLRAFNDALTGVVFEDDSVVAKTLATKKYAEKHQATGAKALVILL